MEPQPLHIDNDDDEHQFESALAKIPAERPDSEPPRRSVSGFQSVTDSSSDHLDSGIDELENRVPALYAKLRPYLRHALLALSIALLWRSAPLWLTAFACLGFLIQFIPNRTLKTSA